jgi:hypothetical protein
MKYFSYANLIFIVSINCEWLYHMAISRSRLIKCSAPIRICDLGGWTDTWFARHGAVLNIAVFPDVEVIVRMREEAHKAQVTIHAENYKDTYN